jgi:hypothetical protein
MTKKIKENVLKGPYEAAVGLDIKGIRYEEGDLIEGQVPQWLVEQGLVKPLKKDKK